MELALQTRITWRTMRGTEHGRIYSVGTDGVYAVRVRDSRRKTYWFARVWPQDIIRIYQ